MSNGWATAIAGFAMVVGVAGTVVPILPGLGVIWAASVGYGLAVGFGPVGLAVVALNTVMVAASFVAGVLVPRRMAVSRSVGGLSQLVAVVGAIVGFFVVPVVGIVLGALVGLFGAEYLRLRAVGPAWEATVAVAKGFGLRALIDLGLGLVMITLWGGWALTVLL